jgi:hypothetical protein
MTSYISAANINQDKFTSIFCQRTHYKSGEKYNTLPLTYNNDKPLFKLQIVKGRIITNKKGDLILKISLKNEDDISGLSKLNKGFARCVYQHKIPLKMHKFDLNIPYDVRSAFMYPHNRNTDEIIEGSTPTMDLKIRYNSIFQLPKSVLDEIEFQPFDPKDLLGKDIICSVIINASHLHQSGSMIFPQIYVKSCIVLDIKQVEIEHTMEDDVINYLMQKPERIDLVNSILAKPNKSESAFEPVQVPVQSCPPGFEAFLNAQYQKSKES